MMLSRASTVMLPRASSPGQGFESLVRNRVRWFALLSFAGAFLVLGANPATANGPTAGPNRAIQLHGEYGDLLERYVRDGGVDYACWINEEGSVEALDDYIEALTVLDPTDWPTDDGLAYWINLYNAVTVQLILKNYPIDSIKDIGGLFKKSPWKRELVTVGARTLTLNDIENEIIRPTFREPRIHFALNCASVGCPTLQPKPYLPESMDSDLDSASTAAMNGEQWVSVHGNEVKLSKIFNWYKDDFAATGVLGFINRYRIGNEINSEARISYLDYDWSLNRVKLSAVRPE